MAKRTETLDDHFIGGIASGLTISAACGLAGYGRRIVYGWRAADAEFRERWDEAVATAIDRLEAEADRRAVDGTLEPVFYQGQECGQVRKFSDTLLIFRLKALKPEKYRDRTWVEHTGVDGKDLIPAETETSAVALALLTLLRDAHTEKATPETGPGPA